MEPTDYQGWYDLISLAYDAGPLGIVAFITSWLTWAMIRLRKCVGNLEAPVRNLLDHGVVHTVRLDREQMVELAKLLSPFPGGAAERPDPSATP